MRDRRKEPVWSQEGRELPKLASKEIIYLTPTQSPLEAIFISAALKEPYFFPESNSGMESLATITQLEFVKILSSPE